VIIGIDLGTTNSASAIYRDDGPILIPNRLGHSLTPSAVSVDDDAILVGLTARERQATHPNLTVTAFKRYMGTERHFTLGKRNFSPEELSALVLRSLREDAEAFLGQPVREAVITVPAYFNDKQRRATRRAGELAGLKVERLVNEPTAAALAYGIHQLDAESRFLVFDLGGGTFDVSVLEIFEGIIEVRASTGDNRLGGEDFNELLVAMVRERLGDVWSKAGRQQDALYQKLREQAERARRALSEASEATMRVIWNDEPLELTVTATEFEERASPLLARLREPVLRALRDSNLDAQALAEIILIGGATRMPLVRKAVTRMFGRFPNTGINPDEAVALGAAVQAGLKARDQSLREVVLTDVCPFSLGVSHGRQLPDGSIESGLFSPIIERNTPIPASRVKSYFTMRDNQQIVELDVYQGEARHVADNVKIGDLKVAMRPAPAGQRVDVRFSYDINGLLEVDVHVPAHDERWQLVIADGDEEDEREIDKRREALAALKIHPRDAEPNRAALARANRCWESALGESRLLVEHWIDQFQAALVTQDPRIADRAREELVAALDQFEGSTFL
jgi:molecular chaperone HscC